MSDNERGEKREHVKVGCWCGHTKDRHGDRAGGLTTNGIPSAGLLSGNLTGWEIVCVECESQPVT